MGQPVNDVLEGPVVVGGRRIVVDHRLHGFHVGLSLLLQDGAPRRLRGIEPLAVVECPVQLSDHRLAVARPSATSAGTLVPISSGSMSELDDAHILVEARRQAVVHDPVEACTHQEYQIGFAQGRASSGTDREGIVVGHGSLAHRGIQERQLGAFDELADLVLCPRPGHALAHYNQRSFGGLQCADSAASTASGSAWVRGGSGTVAASMTSSSSHSPRMMSSGKSR